MTGSKTDFSPQSFTVVLQHSSSDLAQDWELEKLEKLREVLLDRICVLQQSQKAETATSRKSRWDSDSDEEPTKKKKKNEKKKRVKETVGEALASSACRPLDDYALEEELSEGTYGQVWRATRKANGDIVAIKKVKFPEKKWDGFPIAALRETNVLFTLHHPNIIHAREMVIKERPEGSYPPFDVFLVMDYYPYDLAFLMDKIVQRDFHQAEVKLLMRQLLDGLSYMHSRWHMHRDLKPSNLLCRPGGSLVICDFGLTKEFSDPPGIYTTKVVTLHYRPPELLLSVKAEEEYDGAAVDLWSVGCIFFEMLTRTNLFPAEGEAELLNLIWHTLGTPVPDVEPKTRSWPEFANLIAASDIIIKPQPIRRLREKIPGASSMIQGPYLSDIGMDLLESFLMLNPKLRRSAASSLSHPWFTEELPKAREIGQMPF